MSPAAELRAAARTLRAARAELDSHTGDIRGPIDLAAEWRDIFGPDDPANLPEVNAWIRAVPPTLAEPLADLLAEAAAFVTEYPDLSRPHVDGEPCDDHACRIVTRAIDVARVLNGTEEETAS